MAMKARLMSKWEFFKIPLFSITTHKSIPQIYPSEYIKSQAWATQVRIFPGVEYPFCPV